MTDARKTCFSDAQKARFLELAVRENVAWCAMICALHGVSWSTVDGVWSTSRPAPRYYPDVITADPGAASVLPHTKDRSGCSVKDSYASLDLRAAGFTVLFDATWVHLPAPTAEACGRWRIVDATGFGSWERACFGATGVLPSDVLAEPSVRILGVATESGFEAGAVVHHDGEVIGLSNVFGAVDGSLLSTVAAIWPGVDVVGYEHGASLRELLGLGFDELGPLRVWVR